MVSEVSPRGRPRGRGAREIREKTRTRRALLSRSRAWGGAWVKGCFRRTYRPTAERSNPRPSREKLGEYASIILSCDSAATSEGWGAEH